MASHPCTCPVRNEFTSGPCEQFVTQEDGLCDDCRNGRCRRRIDRYEARGIARDDIVKAMELLGVDVPVGFYKVKGTAP